MDDADAAPQPDLAPADDDAPPHMSVAALRRRPTIQAVVLLVLGALFGAIGTLTWSVAPSARTVNGVVGAVDPTGSALLLVEPADLAETGLGLVGVLWSEEGETWQRSLAADGLPTCLGPEDVGSDVRIGLVTDPGGVGRPAAEVVAWLECLPG